MDRSLEESKEGEGDFRSYLGFHHILGFYPTGIYSWGSHVLSFILKSLKLRGTIPIDQMMIII